MKTTLFIILALAFSSAFSQSFLCPHDTCINGGFPSLGDFQWSGGGDSGLGECPTCIPMDRFYSWTLLDTGNLVVIHGNFAPPCDTVQIRVVSQCRYVYKDTCLALPVTGSGCEFIMDIDPPADAHLIVYWRSSGTDSIGVISNGVNDGNPLSMILYDMHLCSVLSTPSPGVERIKETSGKFYYELEEVKKAGMTGIRPKVVAAEDRKPDCAYIRAKTPYIQ